MSTQSFSSVVTINQVDVLYVGQQILRDLRAFSVAYPSVLSLDDVMDLNDSFTTFLYHDAVTKFGYTIHDPSQNNLVYHELRYEVLKGGEIASSVPSRGEKGGTGGNPIIPVWIPSTVQFTPWIIWSSRMLNLTHTQQRQIVSGTGWNIPSESGTFKATYQGGNWGNLGVYYSGDLGVSGKHYTKR